MAITHERRRVPRAQGDFPIQLTQRAEGRSGNVVDISENGLCCTYPEAIQEMTLVNIDLQLPTGKDSHTVQGAVVRCEKRRDVSPPTYEVAVYFTELPPEARAELRDYVARSASK